MAEISLFHPDMLIWIDETGSDRRNSIRKYGYSLRGIPARVFQLHVGGKRISAIGVKPCLVVVLDNARIHHLARV